MGHKIFVMISIFIFALFQCSIFPISPLLSITPNLLLGLTISFALMRGSKSGMTIGFICGLVIDILSGTTPGAYALLYLFVGFLGGMFNKLFYPEELRFPLFLIAIGDFFYGILVYLVFFLMRGDLGFTHYLLAIIIPEMIYTFVCMIVLYPIILKIEGRFLEKEKRNAKKFV